MSFDPMDLRLLRIFQAVVEAGGFSAAQAPLNLTLATISNHVSTLEGRLGVVLCRRGRSGFALTERGQAVYEEFVRLSASIGQFDARLRSLKGEMTGTLSIGLADNTITDPGARLDRVFARFTDAAPEVTLSLATRPPHENLRDLVSGQLDVAVASFPRAISGLSYLPLYAEQHLFYCGPGHPLFGVPEEEIDLEVVRQHRIVGRSYWGVRDMRSFAMPDPSALVGDMESEAQLILSGRYVGYLPGHYGGRFVKEGRMRVLRPDLFSYDAPFQAAFAPEVRQKAAAGLFLDLLEDGFASGLSSGAQLG